MLIAPLDWGLGHATRCIPLIRELLEAGCEVIIAAAGKQQHMLQEEFPLLRHLHLPGYQVTYSRRPAGNVFKILLQIPRILSSIRFEHQWLKENIAVYRIDLVISDNRYGLYNRETPSIFITHQLLIKTSLGTVWDKCLQYLNYRFINRFAACWVPDYEDTPNLAGELSHPKKLPSIPVEYIGALSRFSHLVSPATGTHMLFLLSGPEPQRSILEALLARQLEGLTQPAVLVRGVPGDTTDSPIANSLVKVFNHLPTDAFRQLIMDANVVVCRSGYSSVMDLIPAGCRCAFIPTPGQPEQLYLANYLSTAGLCLSYQQNRFSVDTLLNDMKHFVPQKEKYQGEKYKEIIRKTLLQRVAID